MAKRRGRQPWWSELPREELLDVRFCDLGLRIEGTALERRVERLYAELERAGLRFRPHVWLATDWFTPDGVTGFAIPFYLAHRRLVRLEHEEMFEAEGADHDQCMRLLRHETGHAIDNAYRLRRKKRYREVFGPCSQRYGDVYAARPASRDYVQNLDYWYAQSHPVEDFAETFAVWLWPGSRWRLEYAGWPAFGKLECVDDLMAGIARTVPPVRSRRTPDSLPTVRMTLRDYYRMKKAHYAPKPTTAYDRSLLQIFGPRGGSRGGRTAAWFLYKHRRDLRKRVAAITGRYRYVVDQALKTLILRSRELDLGLVRSQADTRIEAAVLLAVVTMRLLRERRPEFLR